MRLPLLGGRGLSFRQRAPFARRVEQGSEWLEAIARERELGGSALATPAGQRLLEQDDDTLRAALFAALIASEPRQTAAGRGLGVVVVGGETWLAQSAASELATALARRKLSYTIEDVQLLLAYANGAAEPWTRFDRLRVAVAAAESFAGDHGVAAIEQDLRRTLDRVERSSDIGWETDRTRLLARLRKLVASSASIELVSSGDAWGAGARKLLAERGEPGAAELVLHLSQATSGPVPSAKWVARARELIDDADGGDELVRELLELAVTVPDGTRRVWGGNAYRYVVDENAVLLRGLIWAAGVIGADWAARVLGGLADHAASPFEGGYEERSMKVANAAVRQLGALESDDALAVLSQLRGRIKHRSIRKQVETALGEAAERTGLSKGQLVERQVPTFGLASDGSKEVAVGDATAIVRVEGDKAALTWRTGTGRAVKSVPKQVRDDHVDELKRLRAELKELKKALGGQRARLEGLFAEEREWPYAEWLALYRDHPLVGGLARRLIWRFDDEAALGEDAPKSRSVRLWRPIDVPPDEVAEWRSRILEAELVQPFKQAFREVYHLAPAEQETATYSNRFAAHIVRYTQAYALMKARGWTVAALGPWDYGSEGGRSRREFHDAGITAEFWMDYVESGERDELLANLASTDQVRFVRGGEPMPLEDVPAGVFSETMRDVDLFVSVASIAGDPWWLDRGAERFNAYWHETSFGELSETAETRRDVLRSLVPQLKIADHLELTEKFLVVRGSRRTYKIHLGSANVLMEPNDEYLCIVAGRGSGPRKLYLPFEEDSRLSVILSKAFLLADDERIDDPAITRQISRQIARHG
jgi:Domain of unknown function (DUF4132)